MNTDKLDAVIGNMRNTILGKQQLLDIWENRTPNPSAQIGEEMAAASATRFLRINVDELNRILVDLEEARKDLE